MNNRSKVCGRVLLPLDEEAGVELHDVVERVPADVAEVGHGLAPEEGKLTARWNGRSDVIRLRPYGRKYDWVDIEFITSKVAVRREVYRLNR